MGQPHCKLLNFKTVGATLYTLLKNLWKILEDSGRKWKIIHTFVSISVKRIYGKIYRRI